MFYRRPVMGKPICFVTLRNSGSPPENQPKLLMGQRFGDADPWGKHCGSSIWPPARGGVRWRIEAVAQAADCRALPIIDASTRERHAHLAEQLAAFLVQAARSPLDSGRAVH